MLFSLRFCNVTSTMCLMSSSKIHFFVDDRYLIKKAVRFSCILKVSIYMIKFYLKRTNAKNFFLYCLKKRNEEETDFNLIEFE